MATLSNEKPINKLRKKAPPGCIGSYDSDRQYADKPGIVAAINKLNRAPYKSVTELLQLLWFAGYDSVSEITKNTATTNEEGKRVLVEKLTALKNNVALDDVGALGLLFSEDEEIQSKLNEYNAAKSAAAKSIRKQIIQALAASQLHDQAKSVFPGTSGEELQLKSTFDSNDKAFADRTRDSKRKASNELAKEAEKQRKTVKDELAAAMETGDADLIASLQLTLRDAEETANTAYAHSVNGKQAARRKDSNDEANEAKQQVKTVKDELAAAMEKGADQARIASLQLTLSDAEEKAKTANAHSFNGKQAARRKDSNDEANEAKQQVKAVKDELAAAMEKGADEARIAELKLTLSDAEEKAKTANAHSFNGKQAARRKDSNDEANKAKQQVKAVKDELAAAMEKGADEARIAELKLTLSDAEEKAKTANAHSFNGKEAARRKDSNDEANEAKQQVGRAENDLALALTTGADEAHIAELKLALRDAEETANTAYVKSRNGKEAARHKASNELAKEAEKQVKAVKDELAAAMEKGDQARIASLQLTLSDAEEKANTAYVKSRNGKVAARRNVIKVGDVAIDRRTLFSGLDKAIAKQEEYTNPTQRAFEIQRILRKGVEHCESSQAILAKIKGSLENSVKE